MGDLKDVRRAAREAGRRLGWKSATRLVGGRLFVLNEREVPGGIKQLSSLTTQQPRRSTGLGVTVAERPSRSQLLR